MSWFQQNPPPGSARGGAPPGTVQTQTGGAYGRGRALFDAHQRQQTGGGATTDGAAAGGSSAGPTFGPTTDWSNVDTLVQYFTQAGVDPDQASREAQYWMQPRLQQLLKSDPNYFWTRLQAAESLKGTSAYKAYGGDDGGGDQWPTEAEYHSTPWTGGAYKDPDLPDWLKGPYEAGTYTAPTEADLLKDPGYLTRMHAGEEGMQRNAAARGTLLSGGTLKALERYRQDYGANEYGALNTRSLNAFQANEAGRFGARGLNEQAYQNAVGNARGVWDTNYGQYLGENARTLSDYLTNVNVRRNTQGDYWQRLRDLSGAGLGAANS